MPSNNDAIKEAYASEFIRWHKEKTNEWDIDYWYTRCEHLICEVNKLKKEIASLSVVREEIDTFVKEGGMQIKQDKKVMAFSGSCVSCIKCGYEIGMRAKHDTFQSSLLICKKCKKKDKKISEKVALVKDKDGNPTDSFRMEDG